MSRSTSSGSALSAIRLWSTSICPASSTSAVSALVAFYRSARDTAPSGAATAIPV